MDPSVQHNDARFLELLRRWQSGDFTRADEQELNALTASDDFRREAMEGFMSLPETAHDERLTTLRLRLHRRTGGGRVLALPQILAAAAVLVLLIAAILFFPKWNAKDTAPVAQAPVESPDQELLTEPAPTAMESPDNQGIAGKSPATKSAPSASGPSQPATVATPGAAADIAATEKTEPPGTGEVPPENAGAATTQQPPLAAPPPSPSRAIADKIASESEKDRAVESVSNRPEQFAKSKKSKAAARPADSTWHETDRKPDMAAEKKSAREQNQPKESEPEGGWEAFNEYLRQNARLTPEARNSNTSGTVQLQFNVNANGDPQGFVILRSVGYGCDQEAIRLVRNWEWKRGQNPIVTVDVPFVR